MTLQEWLLQNGAVLAADGIPLHFGDQRAEFDAAHSAAVLMVRSHEGRLEITGHDRLNIVQRISTNDVLGSTHGEGRPTILTTPQGRIIDRLMVYNFSEKVVVTTEPGRGTAVRDYLQRQIFFNDDMKIADLAAATTLFTMHGTQAADVMRALSPTAGTHSYMECISVDIAEIDCLLLQRKALIGTHWAIIAPLADALTVWRALLQAGEQFGLRPAGSLTYNALRIQAGRPAFGRELSTEFIPLEAGLWDEVSFKKGCYTGQEIIARMESRNRLAKTMVTFGLSGMVDSPAPLVLEGAQIGTLTSSVITPRGDIVGIGFVKVPQAEVGNRFTVGNNGLEATITSLAGAQPPALESPTRT